MIYKERNDKILSCGEYYDRVKATVSGHSHRHVSSMCEEAELLNFDRWRFQVYGHEEPFLNVQDGAVFYMVIWVDL